MKSTTIAAIKDHYSTPEMKTAVTNAKSKLSNIFNAKFPITKEFKAAEKKFYALSSAERKSLGKKFGFSNKQAAIESLISA